MEINTQTAVPEFLTQHNEIIAVSNGVLKVCPRGLWETPNWTDASPNGTLWLMARTILPPELMHARHLRELGRALQEVAKFPENYGLKETRQSAFDNRETNKLLPMYGLNRNNNQRRCWDMDLSQEVVYRPNHRMNSHSYEGIEDPDFNLLAQTPDLNGSPAQVVAFLDEVQFPGILPRVGQLLYGLKREVTIFQAETSRAGKTKFMEAVCRSLGEGGSAFTYIDQLTSTSGEYTWLSGFLTSCLFVVIDEGDKHPISVANFNQLTADKPGVRGMREKLEHRPRLANPLIIAGDDINTDPDAQGISERIPHIWHYPDAVPILRADFKQVIESTEATKAIITRILNYIRQGETGISPNTEQAAKDWKERACTPPARVLRDTFEPAAGIHHQVTSGEIRQAVSQALGGEYQNWGLGKDMSIVGRVFPGASPGRTTTLGPNGKQERIWKGLKRK